VTMLTRRETIGGLGAAAALMSNSGVALAQSRPRKGSRLRPGDTVGVIAPAGWPSDPADYDRALQRVSNLGLVPKPGAHLRDRHGYLAGTDPARAADVNAMFADHSVKAILAIRGGWGCARLLPYLDWNVIHANPKILAGFSDITALHMAIAARGGFPTIHGPNIGSEWGPQSMDTFRRLVFDAGMPLLEEAPPPAVVPPMAPPSPVVTGPPGTGAPPLPMQQAGTVAPVGAVPPGSPAPVAAPPLPQPRRTRTIRPGRASGRLLGGNLTVLSALVGTPYLPSFDGAILFIEDVEEAEYRVDRMLTQLSLAGILRRLAGVVFGQCTRCDTPNPGPGSVSLDMVLNNHFSRLNVPAFAGAWFGHISNQLNIPVGVRAEIDAGAGTIRVLESAVA
jgi:muramoyltetrapeptide carboxypeptidase